MNTNVQLFKLYCIDQRVGIVKGRLQAIKVGKAYNPKEPRDNSGKWTRSGAVSSLIAGATKLGDIIRNTQAKKKAIPITETTNDLKAFAAISYNDVITSINSDYSNVFSRNELRNLDKMDYNKLKLPSKFNLGDDNYFKYDVPTEDRRALDGKPVDWSLVGEIISSIPKSRRPEVLSSVPIDIKSQLGPYGKYLDAAIRTLQNVVTQAFSNYYKRIDASEARFKEQNKEHNWINSFSPDYSKLTTEDHEMQRKIEGKHAKGGRITGLGSVAEYYNYLRSKGKLKKL